jgi:acetylornithine deacetylase/succinyl-diaminopimelate desuccinylase-like protein
MRRASRSPSRILGRYLKGEQNMVRCQHSSRISATWIAAIWILNGPTNALYAQGTPSLDQLLEEKKIQAAVDYVNGQQKAASDLLMELGRIASPSGREHKRAAAVKARMESIRLQRVSIDETPNVVGVIPGTSGKSLVFISTLDDEATVEKLQKDFARDRDLSVQGNKVIGPGTNDSSVTVAMLTAAEAIIKNDLQPVHDLVFAAVAQEETCLVGMQRLYKDFKDRSVAFVDILGAGHQIWDGAITIHQWKVVALGPEGHTLGGGLPNVNQGIARAVEQIFQLPEASDPGANNTVINIAMLSSGGVFNLKPKTGYFSLDIRSMLPATVASIEAKVDTILRQVSLSTPGVTFRMEEECLTPGSGKLSDPMAADLLKASKEIASKRLKLSQGGTGPDQPQDADNDCPLSSAALRKMRGLSQGAILEVPFITQVGSSNMNVAIGGRSPAIAIVSEDRGGKRNTIDEWACIPTMIQAAEHVLLLAVMVGGAK